MDQLIICSYAPRSSKFNPIEVAWGTLSTALAQIMLVSDYSKYNFKEILLMFFPMKRESLYNNYADIKDAFYHGQNSGNHVLCKAEMQFLLNHCIKWLYYLHLKKYQGESCAYCSVNPQKIYKH